jgi:hypothetical protein
MTLTDTITNAVPRGTVTCRLAEPDDLPGIMSLFARMLQELEPLGHSILPTERNLVLYMDHVFGPALDRDKHGIAVATIGTDLVAATFFTPVQTAFDMPPGRVTTHGIYVSPEQRHSRLVIQLLKLAKDRLRALGYTTLINFVLHTNAGGMALARYLHSKPVGTELSTPI